MNLCVIIPAYERIADVLLCLNSLRALQYAPRHYYGEFNSVPEHRVAYHIQDDASPSVNFEPLIPREIASCTRNTQNLGFAGNCNLGGFEAIQQYQPDILLFCNQDVYATNERSRGWDAALLAAFDDPGVGIVAPRLLFPTGQIQSVGGVFDTYGQPVHRCLNWTNPRALDTAEDVMWATGAALAVRVGLFAQLGGFDEGYRMYFEDVDLCLRAREAGFRVRYTPACTLMHRVGSTGGSPHFAASARRFKAQWVDSGKVKPGTLQPTGRYW